MTFEEYEIDGACTCCTMDANTMMRLQEQMPRLTQALKELRTIGHTLDEIKRQVFYNSKNSPVLTPENSVLAPEDVTKLHVIHGVIGIFGEADEVINESGQIKQEGLVEESGDFLWYLRELIDGLNTSMNEVATKNINKLKVRYPNKFTDEAALNRNIEAEQKVFE